MMKISRRTATFGGLGVLAERSFGSVARANAAGQETALSAAVDAYIYGYPLAIMDTTRRQLTNVATAGPTRAPMGQLRRLRSYPAVDDHSVPAPNADTLYTYAWLDVSKEPMVLTIPDMGDRYFMMPMLSGWTNVFQAPGTRTTGQRPQSTSSRAPDGPAHFLQASPNTNRQPALSGFSAASIARARRRTTQRFTHCRTRFLWFR